MNYHNIMGVPGIISSLMLAGTSALVAVLLRGKFGALFSRLNFHKSDFGETVGLIFIVILISAIASAFLVAFLFVLIIVADKLLGYSEQPHEISMYWILMPAYVFTFLIQFSLGIGRFFKK